jgi:hypothetical protein
MKKAFVTYSHEDSDFVSRLINDLENAAISISFDKKILKPGDSLLDIFDKIGNSDFLLPIISTNSISSNWVKKELSIAIVKEIEEEDFTVIPIIKEKENWDSLKKLLPTKLKESLRDKFYARFDIMPYEDCLPKLIEALTPEEQFAGIYSKIRGPNVDNPFRRVRTENFEDLQILANFFARPESARYDKIIELKPTRLEGGRGSGKTMILKSMTAQVSVFRLNKTTFEEANLSYYGVYCRLTQGSFATQAGNILDHIKLDQASILFASEFYLQLINSLVDEICNCSEQHLLEISSKLETEICHQILRQLYIGKKFKVSVVNFIDLRAVIQNELGTINDYLNRKILGESGKYPGIFVDKTKLRAVCKIILDDIPELNKKTIYFLLDEYENLLPFQKVVINTLLKWSEQGFFSVKIAAKKTGFKDPQTLENQEIEEGHDYTRIDLDYDLSKSSHRTFYKKLLLTICQKTLMNDGFSETNIEKILEAKSPFIGFETEVDEILDQIVQQQKNTKLKSLKKAEQQELRKRMEFGAFYRVLAKKHKKRQFSGFDDLMILSSGIIRYFLELCGTSYYYAIQDDTNVKKGEKISAKHQSEAVYALSNFYLYNIRKNLVKYGSDINRLVIDFGDIFRIKILNHLTEPEAARVSIIDPQYLSDNAYKKVNDILDLAEMHSVLQSFGGIEGLRPKHAYNVQPKEYILNRIYSPVLQYSPRSRWRTSFKTQEIADLINPKNREAVKADLIQKVSSLPKRQIRRSQKTLIDLNFSW